MLQQIKEYLYTHVFYIFLVYTSYSQWTQTVLPVMFLNKLKRLYSINHFREEKGHTAKNQFLTWQSWKQAKFSTCVFSLGISVMSVSAFPIFYWQFLEDLHFAS